LNSIDDENNNNPDDPDDNNSDHGNFDEEIMNFFATPEKDGKNDDVFITERLNDSIDSEITIWVFK
jgi:hypothetical protein